MLKSNVLFTNRIPLANFLRLLGAVSAKSIITSLVYGCLKGLQEQKITLTESENLIFNPDILRLCQEQKQDEALIEVIAYGMELSDIDELVGNDQVLAEAIADCFKLLSPISLPIQPSTPRLVVA